MWDFKNKQILIKRSVGAVVLILLSAYLLYTYQFTHLKNFKVVIPQVLYRSGQPSVNDIQAWHDQYQIKDILNLRGHDRIKETPEIIKKAKELNIHLSYVRLSARQRPRKEKLNLIIDAIGNTNRPLLVHCMGGVDRSGLVSTIALILNNYPLEIAMQQMDWLHGFLPFRKQNVLKVVMMEYKQWLDKNNLVSNRDNFIFWAQNLFS